MNRQVVTLGLILSSLLVLAVALGFLNHYRITANSTADNPGSGKAFYITQELLENCDFNCDIRLLKIAADGTSSTVVDNLSSLFREQTDGPAIGEFYFPPEGDNLFFATAEGSSKCCRIYRFNVDSLRFSPLKHGRLNDISGDLASPDNKKILRISEDGKELSVVDVPSDRIVATLRAAPGESFVEQIGGYGGDPLGRYQWSYDGFEYSVFPQEFPQEHDTRRPPLRTEFYILDEW